MRPIPIVALDVPGDAPALEIVAMLGETCDFYKIGGELFTASGPRIVEAVQQAGKRVFLDLKFHDIPNTVRSAARSAASCGASLITVHAIGGREMIEAAVDGAGGSCGVLAVTVLTSLSLASLSLSLGRQVGSVSDEVSRLAQVAREASAHGVVCSGQEVARIVAEQQGELATLVPGVRLTGDEVHDQARVVTPRAASRAGARYIVLGRTVTAAVDPPSMMQRVLDEISDTGD